nr:kunitz-type U15-theraphotoxin-Hs1g-like [Drosophila bipectinata]
MKCILVLSSLIIFLAYTSAQENCVGRPCLLWRLVQENHFLMKVLFILIFLALLANYIFAKEYCLGRPIFQVCSGKGDPGTKIGITCKLRATKEMWYYVSTKKTCQKMNYLGCGGNNNRYCSKDQCLQNCATKKTNKNKNCGKDDS